MEELISEEYLDEQLRVRKIVRENSNNAVYGFDLPLTHFYKLMFVYFTPQSYGSRIENRLLIEYDLIKVSSAIDKGDAKTINEKYGEIKVSFKSNELFNFVQIRPHQNCDFNLLIAIDPDDNFRQYSFIVTNEKLQKLLDECKATNCHGIIKNKIENSQIEYRISVEFGSPAWHYICENHQVEDVKKFIRVFY